MVTAFSFALISVHTAIKRSLNILNLIFYLRHIIIGYQKMVGGVFNAHITAFNMKLPDTAVATIGPYWLHGHHSFRYGTVSHLIHFFLFFPIVCPVYSSNLFCPWLYQQSCRPA